jgi:hypothetical protein
MPAIMKYRKLQIAWSALCGIICLLMGVEWVQSFSNSYKGWHTLSRFGDGPTYYYDSFEGQLRITTAQNWETGALVIYYWVCIAIFLGLVALPWLPWSNRFSVRTLLIGMTLIAVGLGAIVFAVR